MTYHQFYCPPIRLRPLEPKDLPLMYQLENDTTLWDTSSVVQPLSHNTLSNYIATQGDIYSDHQLRLVVDYCPDSNEEPKAIGFVDLTDFSPRHLRAEVGIVLLPEYHRQGLATKALLLLHDYATHVLFLHHLYAYVSPYNIPAVNFFTKNGYENAGQLKDWIKNAERYAPINIFQIIF